MISFPVVPPYSIPAGLARAWSVTLLKRQGQMDRPMLYLELASWTDADISVESREMQLHGEKYDEVRLRRLGLISRYATFPVVFQEQSHNIAHVFVQREIYRDFLNFCFLQSAHLTDMTLAPGFEIFVSSCVTIPTVVIVSRTKQLDYFCCFWTFTSQ